MESGVKAIAYETIVGRNGGLPCLTPMSEIAGPYVRAGGRQVPGKRPSAAAVCCWPSVPGVARANVVILGGGNVGTNACKIAVGMGANVTILDVNPARLAYLDDIFPARSPLCTAPVRTSAVASRPPIWSSAPFSSPGRAAPKLVRREDLSLMKPGAVLVDVAVDQGGCIETTHATTHADPVFMVDGIVHYCVANMPGAVARTATQALVNTTLTYGLRLAADGVEKACAADPGLLLGLNCYDGHCTFPGVAEALNLGMWTPRL